MQEYKELNDKNKKWNDFDDKSEIIL